MDKPWTSDDVLAIARGYQAGCVLAAAAELDLFALLSRRPLSAPSLAATLGADVRGTTVLADALAAIGLLRKQGTKYSIPENVGDLLTKTGPDCVLSMIRHQANCLRRWSQLAQVVQSGQPAARTPSIRGEAADQATFIGAMDEISTPVAPALVDRLGPLEFCHLLDIGGASGTWTIAFLRAVAGAKATLFDLPDVIPLAKKRIADTGLAHRVTFVPGDFYLDALPAGVDLAWCSAIVHQNSRHQNRELFAKIHTALVAGGRIAVRDVVMDESRTHPEAGALFAINMLVATEAGGTYTFRELEQDLLAAGFADVTLAHEGEYMDSVVCACKREPAT